MKLLKFEELMLHLLEVYPEKILAFQPATAGEMDDFEIRKAVELNITNNISVEDLAFLCNTSLSTFKRRFAKIFGTSPNKWILQKRMEIARELLQNNNEKPGDIFYKIGYENHSSFTKSFKQIFGLTPQDFQKQKIERLSIVFGTKSPNGNLFAPVVLLLNKKYMQHTTEQNKQLVIRFNKECIEKRDRKSFEELVAEDVVNHAAPPGTSQGPDGMIHFLQNILRTGFPDLSVEILEQVAEGDLVTTRKAIHATHSGDFMGIPPTGKRSSSTSLTSSA